MPAVWLVAVPLLVIAYAALAVVSYTRWSVDDDGLTLRSAALFRIGLRVPWDEIVKIQTAGWGGGVTALKLDGRYLFQRHVTVVRDRDKWRIRFTPRDMRAFDAALAGRLEGDSGWARTEKGWTRASIETARLP